MSKKILTIIQILLIIVLIFSANKIAIWVLENNKTKENLEIIDQYIEEVIVTEEGEEKSIIQIDFQSLKNINPDTVAYIKINNTNIEHPVVQTIDNDYYLNKTFDQTKSEAGWIFADYRNNLDNQDQNLIIYGHAREDKSMFGSLSDTLLPEWHTNQENKIITFITEEYYYQYEIFSIYTIENEAYYITTEFINDEYLLFTELIKNRSIYDFQTQITTEDKILTLSTCYQGNTKRMVLHAKQISAEPNSQE